MASEISLDSRVRIQDDVLFQELQGESVLLNLKTGMYFGLNPIGTRIWQLLQDEQSLDKIVGVLLEEYEVSQEQLQQDVLVLVGQLVKQELLVEA